MDKRNDNIYPDSLIKTTLHLLPTPSLRSMHGKSAVAAPAPLHASADYIPDGSERPKAAAKLVVRWIVL